MKSVVRVMGVLGIAGGAAACEPPGQEVHMIDSDPTTQAVASDNGLAAVNGLTASNGLVASNGLMTSNGLATSNGLMTSNGLATSNGLMTSNGGRLTVKYLAKCALAAGDSFTKLDNTGTSHTFYGGLGFGSGWKSGACDSQCQEYISACMLAHLNSTGNQVPIWVNADPDRMPHVGFGMAPDSGKPQIINEGVFMGNVFTTNPPRAFYAKGNGFKASIPGRLGASSTNPYKPWEGYRSDRVWRSGIADGLCMSKVGPDGEHWDYYKCQRYDANGALVSNDQYFNVVSTWVDRNYNTTLTQGTTAMTINFDADAVGTRNADKSEVWTKEQNFEFGNHVNGQASGRIWVKDIRGSRRLCIPNLEHIVITKNSGELFSLTGLDVMDEFVSGTTGTIKVRAYKRSGTQPAPIYLTLPANGAINTATLNLDGVIKVEIASQSQVICVDNIRVKY